MRDPLEVILRGKLREMLHILVVFTSSNCNLYHQSVSRRFLGSSRKTNATTTSGQTTETIDDAMLNVDDNNRNLGMMNLFLPLHLEN
jgi:hypothetical protein